MKIFFAVRMSLLIAFLVLCITGAAQAEGKPVVKIVYMAEAEPVSWMENNIPSGILVDISNHICDRLGLEAQHAFFPWKRSQKIFEKGKADLMLTTPTESRFAYAVFGRENILPNYWNVFVHKDNVHIADNVKKLVSLEGLKPYQIVDFLGNGWAAAFLKKDDGYLINEVATLEALPVMLAMKRADVIINSSTWINWWAEKTGVKDQLVEIDVDWYFTRFHYVAMVSRKSPWVEKGLIRALDQELLKMKKNRIWHKILARYKNPHGFGKEFKTHLNAAYLEGGGFYKDYDTYPVYTP